jgi:hypothetical protein
MKKRSIDYGGVKGNQMKRLCTVIMVSFTITLYATSWSFGQGSTKRTTKSPESLDLMSLDVIDVLKVEAALMGTRWELAVGSQKDAPKSNEGALEDFSKWLKKYETKEESLGLQYEKNVRKILGNFKLIGNDLGKFVCDSVCGPVRFAQKQDGIVFLVTNVFSDNVYNTLRTTAKTRASKIIASMILPSMKAFYNSFGTTDIKYYGMVVAYGSKDFSKEGNVLNLRAEVVSLIVSAQTCKKFVEGIITDDELINASEIYSQDRDVKHLKRIKVNLE